MQKTVMSLMKKPYEEEYACDNISVMYMDDVDTLIVTVTTEGKDSENLERYFADRSYEFDTRTVDIPLLFEEKISIQMDQLVLRSGWYVHKKSIDLKNLHLGVNIELIVMFDKIGIKIPIFYKNCIIADTPYKNHNKFKDCYYE